MHPKVHLVGASTSGTEGGAVGFTFCACPLVLYTYFVCAALIVNGIEFAVGYVTGNAVNGFIVFLFAHNFPSITL